MRTARVRLEQGGVKTVWFNAWKYDRKEAIWNALIQTIFYEMQNDPKYARRARRILFRRRVIRASKELAKYSAKVGTRFVPGGILREEDIDGILNALGSSADDKLFEFVHTFETEFDKLVKEYVGMEGYLVVFIDDLDRCLPENAIEVIEALKLYLDRARCIFVLGIEPAIFEEAIKKRYPMSAAVSATDYLEKIVQVPIVLPRARTDMLLSLASVADDKFPHKSRRMGELLRVGTSRNPRRAKRFFNAFVMASRIEPDELSLEQKLSLAKVLLIQMRFPHFYRALLEDPSLVTRLSGAEPVAWKEAGVERLHDDAGLLRFLDETKEIAAEAEDVRRWVRAAAQAGSSDEVGDGDDATS
jgi:KAP family P-loop domain